MMNRQALKHLRVPGGRQYSELILQALYLVICIGWNCPNVGIENWF